MYVNRTASFMISARNSVAGLYDWPIPRPEKSYGVYMCQCVRSGATITPYPSNEKVEEVRLRKKKKEFFIYTHVYQKKTSLIVPPCWCTSTLVILKPSDGFRTHSVSHINPPLYFLILPTVWRSKVGVTITQPGQGLKIRVYSKNIQLCNLSHSV